MQLYFCQINGKIFIVSEIIGFLKSRVQSDLLIGGKMPGNALHDGELTKLAQQVK